MGMLTKEEIDKLLTVVDKEYLQEVVEAILFARIALFDEKYPDLEAEELLTKLGNTFISLDDFRNQGMRDYLILLIIDFYRIKNPKDYKFLKQPKKYIIIRNKVIRIREAVPYIIKDLLIDDKLQDYVH